MDWRIGALSSARCDPGLTKQVSVSLVSNAIKYTRPRGPAVIRVGQMSLEAGHVIFVSDNGAGFGMSPGRDLFSRPARAHRCLLSTQVDADLRGHVAFRAFAAERDHREVIPARREVLHEIAHESGISHVDTLGVAARL